MVKNLARWAELCICAWFTKSRAERQMPGELPWGFLAMGLCTKNSVIVKQEEAQP